MLAELAGIDRAAAYDVIAASAVGAPYVGYKRGGLRRSRRDAGGVLARPRREGPAADHRLSPTSLGHAACRRPTPTSRSSAAASAGGRGGHDFSTVAEELRGRARPAVAAGAGRANEEGRPARATVPTTRDRGRPSARDRNPSRHRCRRIQEAPMADRILIKNGDRPDPGPEPRRAAAGGRPHRRRHDRRRRAEPLRRRREGHRRRGRHRHPGLHRHPPPHLGDVDPDVRAGLRPDHLLQLDPRQVRPALPARRRLRGQPAGARSSASTPGSRRSWTGPTSSTRPTTPTRGSAGSRSRRSGRSTPTASATRRSWTGGSGRTTRAAS